MVQDILSYHSCALIRVEDSEAMDNQNSVGQLDSTTLVSAADAVMNMAEMDNILCVNKSTDNVSRKGTSSVCVRMFVKLHQIKKILHQILSFKMITILGQSTSRSRKWMFQSRLILEKTFHS